MGVVLVLVLVLLVVIFVASDKKDAATSNAQSQTSQQSVPQVSSYISVEPTEFCDKIFFNSTEICSTIREKIGMNSITMYDSDRVSDKSFVKKLDPISILHFRWQEYFRTTSTKGMSIDKTREEPILSPREGYILYHPVPMFCTGTTFLLASIYKDYETLLEQEFAFEYDIKKDAFDKSYSIEWEWINGEEKTQYLPIAHKVLKDVKVSFNFQEDLPIMLVWYRFKIRNTSRIELLFDDETILSYPLNGKPKADGSIIIPITPKQIDCISTKKLITLRLGSLEDKKDYAIDADEQEALMRFATSFKEAFEEVKDFKSIDEDKEFQDWCERVNQESAEIEAQKKKLGGCCWVYLMHDLANNAYKIGISNKPEYREKTLQSEKPSIEKLAAKQFPTRDIARAFEAALHKVYETRRMRGEWFKLEPNEVEDVKKALE